MGATRAVSPVKLLCGLLGDDPDLLRRARQLLAKRFGPVDLESDTWPFHHTDYYREEMGAQLLRCFVSFEKLISPDRLADIKVETNTLEAEIREAALRMDISRPINLDPGYIHQGKLVLATTKDRAHRIYLSRHIFAEVTLQYTEGHWQPQPWTYPDYHEPDYHAFFTQIRDRLRAQLASGEAPSA